MKALKLAATLLSTLMLAVIGATSAEASVSHGTNVSGFEFYATATEGRFAGTASGTGSHGLWGAWSIVVQHSSLDPCFPMQPATPEKPPCAIVNGGTFTLGETSPAPELVTGQFDIGGPTDRIDLVSGGSGCTDQVFTIQDGLSSVGTRSPFDGTGSFNATLTHHQRKFFGRCVTYAATVQGNVVLNF